jgi:hypothetical protein
MGVIAMRLADLPAGVTPEEAAALVVGKKAASESLIILVDTIGLRSPDTATARPAIDHPPSEVGATQDESGRSPMEVLRSLCGKAQLDLETDDSGNLITVEQIGKKMRRIFADVGTAIRMVRARIAIGNDRDRKERLDAEAVAKVQQQSAPAGIDWYERLAELANHYALTVDLGSTIRVSGPPFDRTFQSVEEAVNFLQRRHF